MTQNAAPDPGLEAAAKKAGSLSALAKLLDCPLSTLSSRRTRGNPLRPKDAKVVEEKLGIPCHETRGDIFDPPHPREDSPAQPPAGSPLPPAGGSRGRDGLEGLRA